MKPARENEGLSHSGPDLVWCATAPHFIEKNSLRLRYMLNVCECIAK